MGAENDYIIVVDSKNTGDDPTTKDTDAKQENNEDSQRTLEAQGIFIEQGGTSPDTDPKHLENLTQELLDQGGIEIMSSEEGEEFA